METGKVKNTDKLTNTIGELGRWQILLTILLSIPSKMSAIWMMIGIIFLAPKTDFRCVNATSTEVLVNSTCYSDCVEYEYHSEFDDTIISEWGLICERKWLVSLTQMVFMFGVLIGSMVFGFVSDRYGRLTALQVASMTQLVVSCAVPFSPNYWTFTALRFVLGTSTAGIMVVGFVIVIEIVGPRKREIVSSFYHVPIALGQMIMPVFAYYLRSWKSFSIGVAVPNFVFLLYLFLVPESPKWLISMGKLEEASEVMKKAAKFNNLPHENTLEVAQSISDELQSSTKEPQKKLSYIDLVTNPSLRVLNLCSCFAWFILGLSFYGGNQYIGQTSNNVYLTIALAGGLQVPGMFSSGFLYKRFGRRPVVVGYLIICTVSNALLALPDSWFYVKLVAGAVAVSCSAGAFSTMYTFTTELFPTVARNMAMGASSTASRVGSMVAPFVAGLQAWGPPAVFAAGPILAAAACLALPETKGRKMLDRLEEKTDGNNSVG